MRGVFATDRWVGAALARGCWSSGCRAGRGCSQSFPADTFGVGGRARPNLSRAVPSLEPAHELRASARAVSQRAGPKQRKRPVLHRPARRLRPRPAGAGRSRKSRPSPRLRPPGANTMLPPPRSAPAPRDPQGDVAQLVRVPDCRSGGCGFESRRPRQQEPRGVSRNLGDARGFFFSGAVVREAWQGRPFRPVWRKRQPRGKPSGCACLVKGVATNADPAQAAQA